MPALKELLIKVLRHEDFKRFRRYAVVGFTSFCIEYVLYTLLCQVLGVWYILANILVYTTTFLFNFFLNRSWSFNARGNLKKQITLFGLLFVFNQIVTNTLLYLLTDMAGIDKMISKIMVMCALVSWNFVIYKKVIYK